MKYQTWRYLLLAYGITWLVWIVGPYVGMAQDTGEYIAAFGATGPVLAAIALSRKGTTNNKNSGGASSFLRILFFVVLWLSAWMLYIANDNLRGVHPSKNFAYYSLVGFLSTLPAWILSGAFLRDSGIRELFGDFQHPPQWRWLAASFLFWPALLLIPSLALLPFGFKLQVPQHHGTLAMFVLYAVVFFLSNFLFTALLEEPGWRGYLLPGLQQRFSPLFSSLLVWFPWALWHGPLDFHRPFRFTLVNYILIRVVFLIPMTIILTWFYNRSGGNLLTSVLFHASMNTFPFVLPFYPPVASLVILFAIIVIFTDRMWRPFTNSAQPISRAISSSSIPLPSASTPS